MFGKELNPDGELAAPHFSGHVLHPNVTHMALRTRQRHGAFFYVKYPLVAFHASSTSTGMRRLVVDQIIGVAYHPCIHGALDGHDSPPMIALTFCKVR